MHSPARETLRPLYALPFVKWRPFLIPSECRRGRHERLSKTFARGSPATVVCHTDHDSKIRKGMTGESFLCRLSPILFDYKLP